MTRERYPERPDAARGVRRGLATSIGAGTRLRRRGRARPRLCARRARTGASPCGCPIGICSRPRYELPGQRAAVRERASASGTGCCCRARSRDDPDALGDWVRHAHALTAVACERGAGTLVRVGRRGLRRDARRLAASSPSRSRSSTSACPSAPTSSTSPRARASSRARSRSSPARSSRSSPTPMLRAVLQRELPDGDRARRHRGGAAAGRRRAPTSPAPARPSTGSTSTARSTRSRASCARGGIADRRPGTSRPRTAPGTTRSIEFLHVANPDHLPATTQDWAAVLGAHPRFTGLLEIAARHEQPIDRATFRRLLGTHSAINVAAARPPRAS